MNFAVNYGRNFHLAVEENGSEERYLRKVEPGRSEKSQGRARRAHCSRNQSTWPDRGVDRVSRAAAACNGAAPIYQPFIDTASAPPSESRLSFRFHFSFDL